MDIRKIQAVIPAFLSWYELHHRMLPWRVNPTPYRIWISEIMLQQTRIEAVIPHYHAFLQRMPNVRALAEISEEELLKFWEGLGYYSRARNLQKAAKQLIADGQEELPHSYDALRKLSGIGEYTAGAIASIAFQEPVPAVDGNVMRVLSRLTGCDEDVLTPKGKRTFTEIAASLLPHHAPGTFNQAMMELGETVCLPNTVPKCNRCPFSEVCYAHLRQKTDSLPVRKKLKARKIEPRTVFVAVTAENPPRIVLHKRAADGLLGGLYEFPNADGALTEKAANGWLNAQGFATQAVYPLQSAKHIFTHLEWHMDGYFAKVTCDMPPENYRFVTKEELFAQYAVPSAFRVYLQFVEKNIN